MTEDSYTPELIQENEPHHQKRKAWSFLLLMFVLFTTVVLGSIFYLNHLNSPTSVATPVIVTIETGDSVNTITNKLEASGIIRSSELLYFILATFFDSTAIKASEYVFAEPLTTYAVAEQLIGGDFDSNLEKLTIFEGESRTKIAERLAENFTWFDSEVFLAETSDFEGQLFPDTYFVPETYTTAELVTLLTKTHSLVLNEYATQIASNELTAREIITLASIVEREANTSESMKIVAGIFKNRLEIGMALQADASIEYVLDEDLADLPPEQLAENLRELDSPYNTYRYPGLPPTPIGNPGRAAIEAVLTPTETDYLYYLTGDDGNFYYAETYEAHLANIDRYLR